MCVEPLSRTTQAILQRAVLALLLSLGSLSCVGQSYIWTGWTDSTPTNVYDWKWVVGSRAKHFGLLGYRYWTDPAGQEFSPIPVTNSSGQWVLKVDPSAVEHRRTRVLLGPLSFSVPLPKVAVAIIGGVLVLALVFLAVVASGRGRHRTRPERKADR